MLLTELGCCPVNKDPRLELHFILLSLQRNVNIKRLDRYVLVLDVTQGSSVLRGTALSAGAELAHHCAVGLGAAVHHATPLLKVRMVGKGTCSHLKALDVWLECKLSGVLGQLNVFRAAVTPDFFTGFFVELVPYICSFAAQSCLSVVDAGLLPNFRVHLTLLQCNRLLFLSVGFQTALQDQIDVFNAFDRLTGLPISCVGLKTVFLSVVMRVLAQLQVLLNQTLLEHETVLAVVVKSKEITD